ncbi:MAG: hypothetical protein WD669_06500 [Pirellulales bacterium]
MHLASSADTVTWDGPANDEPCCVGDGIHWNHPPNWNTDAIPGPGDDAVVGDATPLVLAGELFQIADLSTGPNGGVNIRGTLNALGGTIANNGQILIDHGDTPGGAGLGVGVGTVEGSGTIVLGDSDFTNIGARLAGPTGAGNNATQVAGHTIRGEGTINGNWINNGLIVPEDISGDMTGTLRIMGSMTNNGVLRSSATADFDFNTGTGLITQGATGRIISDTRKIAFRPTTIVGGTLEGVNGGYFEINSNSLRLNQVHNLARIDLVQGGGSVPTIGVEGGGITNDGTIVLNADVAAGGTTVVFSVPGVIGGAGEIILSRQAAAGFSQIGGGIQGTNGASHTIRGVGQIFAPLVNDGTIIAEPRDGTVLEMIGPAKTNNNVIRADSGAVLRLVGTVLTQSTGGRIIANEGTVELNTAPFNSPGIAGGRFETVGAGTVVVATSGARIDDVTNEGVLNVLSGRALFLGGSTFTNNGTVTLQATIGTLGAATLSFASNVTIGGTGEIVLTPELPFLINRILVPTGMTATQAAGHTIRGEGIISGFGNVGTLINNGRIEGTSPTQNIEINGTLGGSGLLKNVQINATHTPGESTAIVPLEGAYTINNFGTKLIMEIGGLAPGTGHDQLLSTDPGNLITIGTNNSTLEISLINGYVPVIGDTFTLMSTAGSIAGLFQHEILPEVEGLEFDVIYNPHNVILAVVEDTLLVGDYNGDGTVNAADYTVWRNHSRQSFTLTNESPVAQTPGVVDREDFVFWKANYGNQILSGAAAQSSAVPEPTTMTAASVLLLIALWCRRPIGRYASF